MSLQDVPPDKVFWLHGGKSIKNILELRRELKTISNEIFAHYVNSEKNDFANWIQHCVKDEQLAILVRSTKNKERMAAIVERRIQELTQPPKREKPKQTLQQTTIIRTKNVTPLSLIHEPTVIRTRKVTMLTITPEKEDNTVIKTGKTIPLEIKTPLKIIHTPHKTQLTLTHEQPKKEIYFHEVKTQHHSAALLISHLVLGIVIGVAIAALAIMLN